MKNSLEKNAVDFFIQKALLHTLAEEINNNGGRSNFCNDWDVIDSVSATWCKRAALPLMSLVNDTRNAMCALKDFVDSIKKIDSDPIEYLPQAKRYYEDTVVRFKGLGEKFELAIKKLESDGVMDELNLTIRDVKAPITALVKITQSYRKERNKYAHGESFAIKDDSLITFISVIDPSAHSFLLSNMGQKSLKKLIDNAKDGLIHQAKKLHGDAMIIESNFVNFCEVFKNALAFKYPGA